MPGAGGGSPMSVKVSTWVWQDSGVGGNDLLVMLALADQADDNGRCWPSISYLASKTRLSESTVKRRIKAIAAAGLIDIDGRDGTSNLYQFTFNVALKVGQNDLPNPGQNDTPVNLTQVTCDPGGRSLDDLGGRSPGDLRTVNEPSVNRQKNSSSNSLAVRNDYPTDFETWWMVYPKKAGKREALKQWQKARKLVSDEALIAGAQRYRDDPNREQKYTKDPERWLKKGCWDDEPLPARNGKPTWDDNVAAWGALRGQEFPRAVES